MERLILALSIALAAAPAAADVGRAQARTAIADYVRGRAADDFGELDVAAASFAAAYRAEPNDRMLALRTLRQAVAAGDMPLALRTAHALDAAGALPPDGTVLLFGEAVTDKDWRRAAALADRIEQQRLFGFLVPSMRAWIAFARHRADPAALIDAGQATPLAAAYAAEHRVLLLLAGDDPAAGASALSALKLPDGARAARLRIAAAAALAHKDRPQDATSMLVGNDPAIVRAREIVARGDRLPGEIDTAQAGLAELFVRVAADVNRGQAGSLALEFARIATMLAPQDSEAWLVTAGLLAGAGDTDAGLSALSHIPPGDPFAGAARDARLTLLVRAGRGDEALAEAKAATDEASAGTADWARYGDLLASRDQYSAAASAYGRAFAVAGSLPPALAWPLLLQQASAQQQAGDWPGAQATGKRALAIAPEQPAVLNFVGYSELDRGGDVRAATALITKASTLAPDDPAITDSLGWSWYRRGDLSRAIPLLERAARGAPAEPDINDHLGDAYWRAGRRFEAIYAWRAALVAAEPAEAKRIRAKIDGDRAPPPFG